MENGAQVEPAQALDEKRKEDAVLATLADPQYKAGRKLIDDGRLEEAVNFFGGLLETRVAVLDGNEMNPALAPLYYEYGNSLLYNAEESGVVFGDAITEAEKRKAMAAVEAQISGATGEGGQAAGAHNGGTADAASAEEEEGPSPNQEAEEDLEIAWENLEMARRIYGELELRDDIRTAIAKVHLRLGDLNMVNGMYNEAEEEFEKCLTHRLALPSPHESRGVADAHVRRAQALFYASTLEGADKDALVTRSLEQYRMAAKIFEVMVACHKEQAASELPLEGSSGKENSAKNVTDTKTGKGKGKSKGEDVADASKPSTSGASAAGGSAEELQDALDAIRETIETMVSGKDMEALEEYKSGAASTTIGFGDSSSSSGAGAASGGDAGGSTTVGFGGTGETSKGGSNGVFSGFSSTGTATANIMVARRKGRPVPKIVENGSNGADREGASKKPKVDE